MAASNLDNSLEEILQLNNRSDVQKLRDPKKTGPFNAAMKATRAIYGAQGHHIFEQSELKRAFNGRSAAVYLRMVKRLNDVGVHVNDSAGNIIAANGNQSKGTTHRNIHDLYKQLPDTDYSILSEDELFDKLVEKAVARKRIAASMIDKTIKGLKQHDPDLALLTPKYLAEFIKARPDIIHQVTKNIPQVLPTAKEFPTHPTGGVGTVSLENYPAIRDWLKIGHGESMGKGGYFNVMPAAGAGFGLLKGMSDNLVVPDVITDLTANALNGNGHKDNTTGDELKTNFTNGVKDNVMSSLPIMGLAGLSNVVAPSSTAAAGSLLAPLGAAALATTAFNAGMDGLYKSKHLYGPESRGWLLENTKPDIKSINDAGVRSAQISEQKAAQRRNMEQKLQALEENRKLISVNPNSLF